VHDNEKDTMISMRIMMYFCTWMSYIVVGEGLIDLLAYLRQKVKTSMQPTFSALC